MPCNHVMVLINTFNKLSNNKVLINTYVKIRVSYNSFSKCKTYKDLLGVCCDQVYCHKPNQPASRLFRVLKGN